MINLRIVTVLALAGSAGPGLAEARTLYVAERYDGIVRAIDTDTGASEVAAFGLGAMIGATVDRRGRLFVHRFDDQTVAMVDPVAHTFVAPVDIGSFTHTRFFGPVTARRVVESLGTG